MKRAEMRNILFPWLAVLLLQYYFQYYLTALYHEAVCGENDDDNDDTPELIDHCHPATHCLWLRSWLVALLGGDLVHQTHLLLHWKSLLWVPKEISVQAMLQMTRMQTESWIKACLGFRVNDALTKNIIIMTKK